MTSRSRSLAHALLIALLPLVTASTGATGGVLPSETVTTAIQGWESRLSIDWTLSGQDITGTVHSKHGSHIVNVQLLAQALDANGTLVGQRVEWLEGMVPAFQWNYFVIRHMPPAASYRVTIWGYDTIEAFNFL